MKGIADALFKSGRDDGRFQPAPKGAARPCHTANAARALCHIGHARDRRLAPAFKHLLAVQHADGGWRCSVTRLGKGAATDASNPGTTLAALDAFRFTPLAYAEKRLDRAVRFLLEHWETRKPLGPCHFGIGSLFMQVEYPFLRHNLFSYVYVLSFFKAARGDRRFRQALKALVDKQVDGKVVVENPNRKLAAFAFCKKGAPSELATKRFAEIKNTLKVH